MIYVLLLHSGRQIAEYRRTVVRVGSRITPEVIPARLFTGRQGTFFERLAAQNKFVGGVVGELSRHTYVRAASWKEENEGPCWSDDTLLRSVRLWGMFLGLCTIYMNLFEVRRIKFDEKNKTILLGSRMMYSYSLLPFRGSYWINRRWRLDTKAILLFKF